MKKLILLIALTVTTAQSSFANLSVEDDSSATIISAQISHFDVRQDWLGYIDQGSIAIDLKTKKMDLTLMSQSVCGPKLICAAVETEYHQIQVEVTNHYTDICGATHYVGVKDETPVDGLLETVHVVDYTTMTCELGYLYPTSIRYETVNPRTQETLVSTFGADRLSLQPTYFQ